jgi:hypothetical protein
MVVVVLAAGCGRVEFAHTNWDAPATSLLFSDELDTITGWTFVGGTWMGQNGELQQTDAAAAPAYAWRPDLAAQSDYRIVTQMRQFSGSAIGALEISFRIDPSDTTQQYYCNWEPNDGRFLIMRTVASGTVLMMAQVSTGQRPPPSTTVTMEVVAQGDTFRCHILEIASADLTVTDATYTSGAIGLKTQLMAGAFEYLHVYAP